MQNYLSCYLSTESNHMLRFLPWISRYMCQLVSRTSSSRQHGQGYATGCKFKGNFYHFRKTVDQTHITAISLGFQIQLGISNSAYVWFPANCDQEGPVIDEGGAVSKWSFRMEYALFRNTFSILSGNRVQ